jgi:hypothetical protein
MSQPMTGYAGNDILNMALRLVYQREPQRFRGSGSVAAQGLQYTYQVTAAPTAVLGPGASGAPAHNLQFRMSAVRVVVTRTSDGRTLYDVTYPMTAYVMLGLSGGRVSISSLSITVSGGGDAVLQQVINSFVVPSLRTSLNSIALPQAANIFGTGLSASVQAANVVPAGGGQHALRVGAAFAGRTGIGAADAPGPADLARLNGGSATNAAMLGLVSAGAVNALVSTAVGPITDTFDKRASKLGFGAGIKGTIRASTPVIAISRGLGSAKTKVSISLEAGIRVPLKGWTWVKVPVPDANVVVDMRLMTPNTRTGAVELTGVQSIKVNINWPSVLRPVGDLLEGLINGVLTLFRGKISAAVRGKRFNLFELPTTIPGTGIPATLSFAAGGLSFFGGSVRGLITVRTS